MTNPNVFHAQYEYEGSEPEGYVCGEAAVGSMAGGQDITVRLYEITPEQSMCPYHYEFEEEWLLLLEGAVRVRTPEGERDLERGDLVCFSKGPDGAHKVTNSSDDVPARVLMFSSSREPAVAVYPDSDKIGVWPGNEPDSVMVRRADGKVDYWDGER